MLKFLVGVTFNKKGLSLNKTLFNPINRSTLKRVPLCLGTLGMYTFILLVRNWRKEKVKKCRLNEIGVGLIEGI